MSLSFKCSSQIIKHSRACERSANSTSTLDLTIKEAVEFLSQPEENYQQCGATFIQHAAFKEEPTKQEVQPCNTYFQTFILPYFVCFRAYFPADLMLLPCCVKIFGFIIKHLVLFVTNYKPAKS